MLTKNRYNVVRIISRLNVGGPAHHAIYLTVGLDKKFPTVLVYGSLDKGDKEISGEIINQANSVVKLQYMSRNIHIFHEVFSIWKVFCLLKHVKPYIVHTHTAKAGVIGRIASIFAGIPIKIHTYHGHVFHSYFNKIKTWCFIFIERFLALFTDRLIAISNKQMVELSNHYRIAHRRRFEIIPLGFDLSNFQHNKFEKRNRFRSKYHIKPDEIAIGIIGRLVPIKNHKLFLDVAKNIKIYTKISARFFIIGGGYIEEELRESTKQLGLEDQVTFCGYLKDMDTVYAGLDIIALTSNNEGTPVSLIEAMAAGTPLVSTNVGGVSDIVPNEAGILVPPNDIKSFSNALLSLIENQTIRSKMEGIAKEYAIKHFNKQRLIEDTRNLYENLLSKKGYKIVTSN